MTNDPQLTSAVNQLKSSIDRFESSSTTLGTRMFWLTLVSAMLAFAQIVVAMISLFISK